MPTVTLARSTTFLAIPITLLVPCRRAARRATIYDCTTLVHRAGLRRAVIRYLWYSWPVSHTAVITAISESTRQELLRLVGCPPDKVRVVYVPVSASFACAAKDFDTDCPTILQVGTRDNKNLVRVAQALAGIRGRLRIVGSLSSEQRAALDRAEVQYSSVAAIPDAQLVQEYRDSDMLVFASTYEGFGLPIAEAQATGRPVVTSRICSMPEVAGDAAWCRSIRMMLPASAGCLLLASGCRTARRDGGEGASQRSTFSAPEHRRTVCRVV